MLFFCTRMIDPGMLELTETMAHFSFILACLGSGYLLRWTRKLPQNTAQILNGLVIYLTLPALVLHGMHSVSSARLLSTAVAWVLAGAWLSFIGAAFFLSRIGRHFKWGQPRVGALILTAGLANTSFVGFSLLEALYGVDSLPIGILIDQLGSFLALSTLGLGFASYYSQKKISAGVMIRKVAFFPAFVALVVALALQSVRYPDFVSEPLDRIGGMTAPLALISVGFQLRLSWKRWVELKYPLIFGLGYRLILAPAIFAFGALIIGMTGRDLQVGLVELAMPPMITAAVIAAEFGLDAEVGNLMAGLGIPLGLLSVPIWARIFHQIF